MSRTAEQFLVHNDIISSLHRFIPLGKVEQIAANTRSRITGRKEYKCINIKKIMASKMWSSNPRIWINKGIHGRLSCTKSTNMFHFQWAIIVVFHAKNRPIIALSNPEKSADYCTCKPWKIGRLFLFFRPENSADYIIFKHTKNLLTFLQNFA